MTDPATTRLTEIQARLANGSAGIWTADVRWLVQHTRDLEAVVELARALPHIPELVTSDDLFEIDNALAVLDNPQG